MVYLIVLGTTDNCQGPLRGAFLDRAQDVCFFGPAGALLYSISIIALISLANTVYGLGMSLQIIATSPIASIASSVKKLSMAEE